MIRRENYEIVDGLAGGRGPALVCHVVGKEELFGHGSLYARVILPPGSSIGYHQHVRDTEPYYILKGHGTFIEADHSRHPVGPGDVCLIQVGEYHALENTGDEDLELMALIYNAPGVSC